MSDEKRTTAERVEAWLNGKSAELRDRMRRVGNGDNAALRIVAAVSAQEEQREPTPIEREDAAILQMLRRINARERGKR